MTRQQLTELIRRKRSYLCIGLDTDPSRLPESVTENSDDPVFEFNRRIIDATIDYAVAYKPNIAFYEGNGSKGWRSLEKTIEYLSLHPGGPVFTIADAKRGDIGNSSRYYARAFFETMPFDAVTVQPYMGHDSVQAFMEHPGKWAIVLALTSNPGALDFQFLRVSKPDSADRCGSLPGEEASRPGLFYEMVMQESMSWGSFENTMFVVGATQEEQLAGIRRMAPDHFLLVPGVGAQGGDLEKISGLLFNKDVGILVNASRSVIYASAGPEFDAEAGKAACLLQQQMEVLLLKRSVI